MKDSLTILLLHNFYQQPGGEDGVFADEQEMMRAAGHRVITYTRANAELAGQSQAQMALTTLWNWRTYSEVRRVIAGTGVDLVHCHNTFPLISPAVYWAAASCSVPVVQTVHNYRLVCAAAIFARGGAPCEDCITTRSPMPAWRHRCYRGSLSATAVHSLMNGVHRAAGSWTQKVTRYIALTEFMREKLVQGGIPREKIRVKPNTILQDSGSGDGEGDYILFVGRLSAEKGVNEICQTWLDQRRLPELVIAGDGPLSSTVSAAIEQGARIRWEGAVSSERVTALMKSAKFLIVPSLCYEGFPRVVVEAYAAGLPVLASRIGALGEIVRDGETGFLFHPGSSEDLARAAAMADGVCGDYQRLRENARREYESRYACSINYRQLREIYSEAIEEAQWQRK